MEKINPLSYAFSNTIVPETILDASGWFETEYIEVTIDSFLEGSSGAYIEWYMAQGWVVYDKLTWYDPHGGTFAAGGGYAVTKYSMSRRKLQAERVLQSMITEFTDAYNEGRQINNKRYDELVAIYNVTLDRSQDELNLIEAADGPYELLFEAILSSMGTDFSGYEADVDGALDDYGDSMRLQINTRFDNELAKARSELVTRGMYNTTIWTCASAGIERERTLALTDLEDKLTKDQLALKDRVYTLKADFRAKTLAARDRLRTQLGDGATARLNLRNQILLAMLNFMERRTDDYPGIDGLANIAAQLGYSEGAAVVAPSA